MNKHILVHGSLAYDLFFYYPAHIENHFSAESKEIYVNLRTVGPEKYMGGCAGNVSYTLQLFGLTPLISSWIGRDGLDYLASLKNLGIDTSQVHVDNNSSTPTAVLLQDKSENQWIIFGEPERPVTWELPNLNNISLAVITSGMPERTLRLIEQLRELHLPYIIDPGKMIADMPIDALITCIDTADILIVNRYEFDLLSTTTELSKDNLLSRAGTTIVTKGTEGADVFRQNSQTAVSVPAVTNINVCDQYGAGDAFLAGFSAAFSRGADPIEAAQAGTVAASYAVETKGSQTHFFNKKNYLQRFNKYFTRSKSPLFASAKKEFS